ncbi:uncharacterized protein [Coffea arabica]|uniref:Uncharacterized protein isoform X2 n=1 Tax=Coffea arabica TaxID=13443 RepID=A0ABM4UKC0_COFAR
MEEGGGGYSVPDGLQLSPFSSVSRLSAADAGTNPANEDSRVEEKKRMERGEKEIRQLLKDIFQHANYYLVFQGVIFKSISGTALSCATTTTEDAPRSVFVLHSKCRGSRALLNLIEAQRFLSLVEFL